jgi:hypothetical protein
MEPKARGESLVPLGRGDPRRVERVARQSSLWPFPPWRPSHVGTLRASDTVSTCPVLGQILHVPTMDGRSVRSFSHGVICAVDTQEWYLKSPGTTGVCNNPPGVSRLKWRLASTPPEEPRPVDTRRPPGASAGSMVVVHSGKCGRVVTVGSIVPIAPLPHGLLYDRSKRTYHLHLPSRSTAECLVPVATDRLPHTKALNTPAVHAGGPAATLGPHTPLPAALNLALAAVATSSPSGLAAALDAFRRHAAIFIGKSRGAPLGERFFYATFSAEWVEDPGSASWSITTAHALQAPARSFFLTKPEFATVRQGRVHVATAAMTAHYEAWALRAFAGVAVQLRDLVQSPEKTPHPLRRFLNSPEVRALREQFVPADLKRKREHSGAIVLPACMQARADPFKHPARLALSRHLSAVLRAGGLPAEAATDCMDLSGVHAGSRKDFIAVVARDLRLDGAKYPPMTCGGIRGGCTPHFACPEATIEECWKRCHPKTTNVPTDSTGPINIALDQGDAVFKVPAAATRN